MSVRSTDLAQPPDDLLGAVPPSPLAQHLHRGPLSLQPRRLTVLIDVAHQRAQVLVRRLGPIEPLVVGAPGHGWEEPLDSERISNLVVNKIGLSAPIGGDNGKSASHRFEYGQPPPLTARSEHETV